MVEPGTVVVSIGQKCTRFSLPLVRPRLEWQLKPDGRLAQYSQFSGGTANSQEDELIFLMAYVQLYRQPSHSDFLVQSCSKYLDCYL